MLFVHEKHFKYNLNTSTPQVFIDMDGTLCDFYRYFAQVNYSDMRKKKITISEISPEHYRKRSYIRKYIHKRISNQKIDYWAKIPRTNYAHLLLNGLRQLKPYVFTGVIEGDHSMEMGKIKWCRRRTHMNFKNDDLDRLLINVNRFEYARNGNCPNILIDDDAENCLLWEQAGGIAHYYMDHEFVAERIVSEVRKEIIEHSNIDFLLEWDRSLSRYVF